MARTPLATSATLFGSAFLLTTLTFRPSAFAASVIEPQLSAGTDVVSDRYVTSSFVYQTLNPAAVSARDVAMFNRYAINPNKIIVLEMPVALAVARMSSRGGAAELFDDYDRGPDGLLLPYVTRCFRAVVRPRGLIEEPEHSRDLTEAAKAVRAGLGSDAPPSTAVPHEDDPATTLIDFR